MTGTPLTLGLTSTELARVTAGTLIIGGSSSGALTVSAAITQLNNTALQLISGGPITVSSTLNTSGGALTLTGTNITVSATLGSTTTGAITLNGPLSGSSNIVMGTGGLTLSQNTNSTYGGVISGTKAVTKADPGTLTLTATNTWTGATIISGGTLEVNGSIYSSSGVTVASGASGALLDGTGTVGTTTVNGILEPAEPTTTGTITTGNVAFGIGGALNINLSSAGADEVMVNGTANLGSATLNITSVSGSS